MPSGQTKGTPGPEGNLDVEGKMPKAAEQDPFMDDPHRMRGLGNEEFEEYWKKAVAELDFLFMPGRFEGQQLHHYGDSVMNWMIVLEEAGDRGDAMVVPELPRSWLEWAGVLTEEYMIRQCSYLAQGILADMSVNHKIYAQLWDSFGEYNIWHSQLSNVRAQELRLQVRWRQGDRSPAPPKDEVLQYRKQFLSWIAAGKVTPLTSEAIIRRGILLFNRRYDCTDSGVINDMLRRFDSKLRFVANRTMDAKKPYAFILGYTEKSRRYDIGDHPTTIEHIGVTVVHSPALAPDAMDGLPHRDRCWSSASGGVSTCD